MSGASGVVVVVGDALLDVDIVGDATRLCADQPAPVVEQRASQARPGGAALVAALLATWGTPTRLITSLGGRSGRTVAAALDDLGVDVVDMGRPAPTPTKQRVAVGGRTLLRLDADDEALLPLRPAEVDGALAGATVVAASDYGRGLLAEPRVRAALDQVEAPVLWDPHPRGLAPVTGCALVTPNQDELRHAVGGPVDDLGDLVSAARSLHQGWGAEALAVTRGADGALVIDGSGTPTVVTAPVGPPVLDPCGAGDALLAAAARSLAGRALVVEAVEAAVVAASRFVCDGGVGAWWASVGDGDPRAALVVGDRTVPGPPGRPPVTVATSGCFDLLHAGHVALLAQARRLGDRLVVLVNSDRSVRRRKGPARPVQCEQDRIAVLRAVGAVDDVVVFGEDTPAEALARLRPDVYVKGGDYALDDLPEAEVVSRHGGTTVILPYLSGRSTTGLLASALQGAAPPPERGGGRGRW